MAPPDFLNRVIYGPHHSVKMTIKQRIIIAVVIQAVMICIIGLFGYLSFNNVLSRLRSIEIIDDVIKFRVGQKNLEVRGGK